MGRGGKDKKKLFIFFRSEIFFPGFPVISIPAIFDSRIMLLRNIGMHHIYYPIMAGLFKGKNESRIKIRLAPFACPPVLHDQPVLYELKVVPGYIAIMRFESRSLLVPDVDRNAN